MARRSLWILHHDGTEELRELEPGRWLVGRDRESWLGAPDRTLSRRHAWLEVDGDEIRVEALATRNGTRVNGRAVEGVVELAAGDEIVLGRTILRIVAGDRRSAAHHLEPTQTLAAPDQPIAASPAMARILEEARRLAPSGLSILLAGESGSGKEVVARFVHAVSPRAAGPFVVINCPALPPSLAESELFGVDAGVATGVTARVGQLEAADGGTLFLDEVGDLPLELQAKLLRFLQDREVQRVGARSSRKVDVRILSATNRGLDDAIASGGFRRDLYYRLAAATLTLPPLRERPEDVEALAVRTVAESRGPGRRLSAAALARLRAHDFPGNVRELVAIVERAALLARGEEIGPDDLGLPAPASIAGDASDSGARARALLDAIDGGGDFWTLVWEPFRRHELPRDVVEELIRRARPDGGSLRELARRLGADDRYRKLIDFLRNHRLA